jgi:hypothetical protein
MKSFGTHGLFLGLTAGLLMPMLFGCPGSEVGGGGTGGMTGAGGAPPNCDAPTMLIQKDTTLGGCLGSTCHSGVFPPDLTATNLKTALLGMNATVAPCKDQPLINTTNWAASVILKRISGTDCGERMPDKLFNKDATYLTQESINCIAGWLAAP